MRPAPLPGCRLKYFEEVFTSEHWMMRIYRVLDKPNRDVKLRNPRRTKVAKRARTKRRGPSGALA
jgi:dolichyl-diphosphooligosaccharide--protein glycosyltransferase